MENFNIKTFTVHNIKYDPPKLVGFGGKISVRKGAPMRPVFENNQLKIWPTKKEALAAGREIKAHFEAKEGA